MNYEELYVGQVWRSTRGVDRKIIDLVHSGLCSDDPDDHGSFEEFEVWYEDKRGRQITNFWDFCNWIDKARAGLIHDPAEKVGFRDEA